MKRYFLFLFVVLSVSVDLSDWLGLDDENSFRCETSRKLIPREYLNDNFCDCEDDGSDEPLTDACANGKYVCDTLHESLTKTIFASHVNDYICDCCDGTDEKVFKCPNTCDEKMKELMAEQEEANRQYALGSAKREEWKIIGQEKKAQRKEELANLRKEVSELSSKKEELETERETQENLEQEEREALRLQSTNDFRAALKLNDLSIEALRNVLVHLSSKSSQSTESVLECLNELSIENIDDVTAISCALDLSEGFSYRELNEGRDELKREKEEVERFGEKEKVLQKRKDKIREEIKKKQEEDDSQSSKKMAKIHEKLQKLKERKPEKDLPEILEDDDDDFHSHHHSRRHNKGYLVDETEFDHLETVEQVELEERQLREEQRVNQEKVDILEASVNEMEGKEESLRKQWEEEKFEEFRISLGVDSANDVDGLRECIWNSASSNSLSRKLLEILTKETGLKTPEEALIAPEEDLNFSREEAEQARNSLSDVESQLRKQERELEKREKEDEIDFGAEQEYYPLHGECYEMRHDKYKYQVCPFAEAKQDHTNLGDFDKDEWANDKSKMVFTRGKWCMDKDRSAVVHFQCGEEPKVVKISEPERCEYDMIFENPASCTVPP